MNFDLNTLSSLMQLLGNNAPAPKREGPVRDEKSASPFARENGIGEKVDILNASEKRSASPNPMASILDALGGKPANGDMMSALLPMLMNVFKKPDPPSVTNGSPQKAEPPREKCSSSYNGSIDGASQKTDSRKRSAPVTFGDAEMFSPISFAGYALISALNILYRSTKGQI